MYKKIIGIGFLLVVLILIASGAQTNKADPILKSKITFVDASNIEVSETSDGGLHIKSTGNHLKNQKIEIAEIDFPAKSKIKNDFIEGWYLADGETIPVVVQIPVSYSSGKYSMNISLSEICIGCFTGTAIKTENNLVNGSWLNYTNLINASYVTLNYTVPVSISFGSKQNVVHTKVNNLGTMTISMNLSNSTGTSNSTHYYSGGKFNKNFTGINVTKNNITEIPFWLDYDYSADQNNAIVWINVSTILNATDTVDIYHNEGNLGNEVGTASNGTSTFKQPSAVSGLQAWFNAGAITGKNDGDTITTWSDGSGLSHDLTQATESYKPLYKTNIRNGNPSVRFDGSNDILKTASFTLNQPETVFVVSKMLNSATDTATFDGYARDSMLFRRATSTDVDWYSSASAMTRTTTPEAFHIYESIFNSASSKISIDDDTYTTGNLGTGNGGGITLGAKGADGFYGNVDILEVIVYNTLLSNEDTKKIRLYLGSKYGFSISSYASPEPTWAGWGATENTIGNAIVYAKPQNHPESENKTISGTTGTINLTLTPGVPLQNIQIFCTNGCNVTATTGFTQNTTIESETATAGTYNYNSSVAFGENITNGSTNYTASASNYLNADFRGTPVLYSTNPNATLQANYPYMNISLGVTNTSLFYYNVSDAYNNVPTSTLSNQSFLDNENATIISTASDVDGNTITCYGTLNGVTLTSCTSNDFGIKSVGTYTYYFNITDQNGTVGGEYPWVNKTATINITTGVYPVTNLSVATGNFYHNWTWINPTNASYDTTSVYINGTFVQNQTIPFYNLTANPHNTSTISLRTVNVTSGLYSTWNNLTSVIPNNPITISGVSSSYSIIEGDSLSIDANYTDADSDTGVFATNATKGSLNSGTGVWSLNSVIGDAGTYQWNVSVSDGYGSTSTANYTLTIESTSSGITREVKIHPSQINLSAVPGDAYGYLCVYTNRTPYINLTGCSKP